MPDQVAILSWAFALGFTLESADGQPAWLRTAEQRGGKWLDHLVGCAKMTALHTAGLITLPRFHV